MGGRRPCSASRGGLRLRLRAKVRCDRLGLGVLRMLRRHAADEQLGGGEVLGPAVDVVDVIASRVGDHVVLFHAEEALQRAVDGRARRQRHRDVVGGGARGRLGVRDVRRRGLARAVGHEVAARRDEVRVVVRHVKVRRHLERNRVVVRARPVVVVVHDRELPARLHPPRPVVARPVRIGGRDDPFDARHVHAAALKGGERVALPVVAHEHVDRARLGQRADESERDAERIADERAGHRRPLGNRTWVRRVGGPQPCRAGRCSHDCFLARREADWELMRIKPRCPLAVRFQVRRERCALVRLRRGNNEAEHA